jgi:Domain of unknown function (DUF4835)
MNKIILFFVLIFNVLAYSQELNCTVTVNTERLPNSNQQVFKTLQTSLSEFVNKTQWTGKTFKQNEKINCSMYIILNSYESNKYSATIQVQSSRLVYDSSYSTPIFNYNDKDFSFEYSEFQQLIFNPAIYESNLISVISFFSHIIIGMDADTFVPFGGNSYYATAQDILSVAQQSGNKGWNLSDGNNSRYFLINDLLAPVYSDFREALATYHSGLDLMTKDLKEAKTKIKSSLLTLGKLNSVKRNAFIIRVFFDAKSDEVASIFSGGPNIPVADLVESLNNSSPLNSTKWATLKY